MAGSDAPESAKNQQLVDEAKARRRARTYQNAAATIVVYGALLVIVGATIVAYPELLSSASARSSFISHNYQTIVGLAAAVAAAVTLGILSPGSIERFLVALFPFFSRTIDVFVERDAKHAAAPVDQGAVKSAIQQALEELFGRSPIISDENEVDEYTVDVIFADFQSRMEAEQKRLKQNSFTNLMWGIVFAVFAFGILGYPLVVRDAAPVTTDWIGFVNKFGPRASLGLLVGVISFFFLRLYASNEYDLKHNKNEITTFESKILAIKWALTARPGKLSEIVLTGLMQSERNFILKKGERTTAGEINTDYNDLKDILVQIGKLTRPGAKAAKARVAS